MHLIIVSGVPRRYYGQESAALEASMAQTLRAVPGLRVGDDLMVQVSPDQTSRKVLRLSAFVVCDGGQVDVVNIKELMSLTAELACFQLVEFAEGHSVAASGPAY